MKLVQLIPFPTFCLLALVISLAGCARSFNPDIERGSGYLFRDGYPEVRFSAIGFLDEQDEPGINVAADIVYGSLIYKKNDANDSLMARIAIDVQILDQENSSNIIKTNRFDFTIERDDPNIVYSQDVFTFEERIPVEPGKYEVSFTLVDQISGKQITGSTETFIPDPKNNVASLTSIRMLGKDVDTEGSEWIPITTYDVQGKVDSLRFIFQVTNNSSKEPMTVRAELIRFESDTTIARPMHYNNYSPSTIQYKGIDFGDRTVIQSTTRKLTQAGSVLIEFKFPQQPRGNYRFEVRSEPTKDTELFKARDFGVKSMNYPSIQSSREMAQPLAYLMDGGDYEEMMRINDPDSLKQAVDRFWLKHIGNSSKTRSVIRMYYERVEEANKQFSNFKEGWKTDTGMIYILFGPPWYVEQHLDQMIWSYAYNRNDPEYNYHFHQPKLQSEFYPFASYLLRRNQYYFQIQYQQLQLWLSGQILNRSI